MFLHYGMMEAVDALFDASIANLFKHLLSGRGLLNGVGDNDAWLCRVLAELVCLEVVNRLAAIDPRNNRGKKSGSPFRKC